MYQCNWHCLKCIICGQTIEQHGGQRLHTHLVGVCSPSACEDPMYVIKQIVCADVFSTAAFGAKCHGCTFCGAITDSLSHVLIDVVMYYSCRL